ncbi:PIKK family atypical protein kinase [Tritrichomonas foetus]|uniref:non-specific serine/threonine protein kinase n=1 Tax=Tritrichomonas foetus TaxID=1144522 RepID=A0A1J4JA31_9EUKA|nr:PIKK family atypical protein kinase [Tritrichomonas foetus]|eukprot:OHS96050.1 PIKK family atypical protein kinase [Tritrichomonas foetus]
MINIDPPILGGSETFDILIKELKETTKNKHSQLSDMSYDMFMKKTNKSIAKTQIIELISDPQQCMHIATKIYTYMKIRKDFFAQFYSSLEFLKSDDIDATVLCAFVQAKLMKQAPRGFLKNVLSKDNHYDSKSKTNLISKNSNVLPNVQANQNIPNSIIFHRFNAYFLYFLIKKAVGSVILCINEYIELLSKIIYDQDQKNRLVAFDSLNLAIKALENSTNSHSQSIIINLYRKAQDTLINTSFNKQHGAFLIIGTLFNSNILSINYQVSELLDFFISVLDSNDLYLLALYNISLLSKYDKDFFAENYFDTIYDKLYNLICSEDISLLVSHSFLIIYDNFPNKVLSHESKLLDILNHMIPNNDTLETAFYILQKTLIHSSFYVRRNAQTLKTIFSKIVPNSIDITKLYINLIVKYPILFEPKIYGNFICSKLQKNPSKGILFFLSKCPVLGDNRIVNQLLFMLSCNDPDIRCNVPSALLNQILYDDGEFVCKVFKRLFTVALSDPIPNVRAMVISAFNDKSYKFLTLSTHLEPLTELAYDENFKVSDEAVQLLGKIVEYDPFHVLVILREMLIKNIYVLEVKMSVKAKSQITQSFYHLFAACKSILPLYCPTFCDIALRELSNTEIGKFTYFERLFQENISRNIINTIRYIANTNISQISSHIQQFVNFFIWLLQQHSTKDLKLSVIKTLYTILTKSGSIKGIDMDQLSSSLISVAIKWNSKKVNLAVLKLAGYIGVSVHSILDTVNNIDISSSTPLDLIEVSTNDQSYYFHCACTILLGILNEDSSNAYHFSCLQALTKIFSNDCEMYGQKYFFEFMPMIIEHVRSTGDTKYIKLLNNTCVGSPYNWILMYKANLIELVQEMLLNEHAYNVIDTVTTLSCVFKRDAEPIYQNCGTILYNLFEQSLEPDINPSISLKCLDAIISLNYTTEHFLFLLYPKLVEISCSERIYYGIRSKALQTIMMLIQEYDLSHYVSLTLRSVSSILLCSNNNDMISHAMQIIFSLLIKCSVHFSFYTNQITKLIDQQKNISPQDRYRYFLILKSEPPLYINDFDFIHVIKKNEFIHSKKSENDLVEIHTNEIKIDENSIKNVTSMQEDETPWNWKEWYCKFVSMIIQQSPSKYIRDCAFLCKDIFSAAESIFSPAFLSVWKQLTIETKLYISGSLTQAFLSDSFPNGIRSSIVSLLEFLEHNECHVMISKQVICKACEQASQFANAYYFAQRWISEEPCNIEANETMIRLSSHFGQTKMMKGIAKTAQAKIDVSTSPAWFELIGEWSTARKIYSNQGNSNSFVKILRCLKHEQLWDEIVSKVDEFDFLKSVVKQSSYKFIINGLFHRQRWFDLEKFFKTYGNSFTTKNSVNLLTISALHQHSCGNSEEAKIIIEKAFDVLAANSRGAIKQDRALIDNLIVKAQQLHEILEIVSFETSENYDFHNNSSYLNQQWERRIAKCPKTYAFYYQLIAVRLNKFSVSDLQDPIFHMLKYALNQEQYSQFDSSINYMYPNPEKWPAQIAFLKAKSIWMRGNREEAIKEIASILTNSYFQPQIEASSKLKSKMYYTYAQWIIDSTPLTSISRVLKRAVNLLEISMRTKVRYYNSFHRWAWASSLMYSKAIHVSAHAVSSIHGFLECLKLRNDTPFSDLVQMISLFFRANLEEKSFEEISQRIENLNDGAFLLILPQLFAQITINEGSPQSSFVVKIMIKLLPKHFHILLSNLLFDRGKCRTKNDIIKCFSSINPEAVSQSRLISDGLILCSSTTLEYWQNDTINAISMIQKNNWTNACEIVHNAFTSKTQPGENQIDAEFRQQLGDIFVTIKKKNYDGSIKSLRKIHYSIKQHLNTVRSLLMHYSAPDLFMLRNSVIAVPGTYKIDTPITYIKQFDPTLEIYHSKQRPRFLIIYGSDGSRHKSLLKGREDLRLDWRLMQFFMLINQHIHHDFKNESKLTRIFRYSITPISKICGLIQFVDGADTIFSLISEYRRSHHHDIFAEMTIEGELGSPNIDSMRPVQRIEMLREASSQTSDHDLRDILWLKSPSSKEWMMRNIRFTQSNALMSIISYVLGIGDRHPSNLLIHRYSGSIIHIDFGDCFEVSKTRRSFPELIPFRLTRMMIKAFGPTEIEGDFRITCEETIKIIQLHVYSIMAVLDIFAQEPLEEVSKYNSVISIKNSSSKNSDNSDDIDNDYMNDIDGDYLSSDRENIDIRNLTNMKESIKKVSEKIIGKDFLFDNDGVNYSIEAHVDYLINNALNEYNHAHLFHGWMPLW